MRCADCKFSHNPGYNQSMRCRYNPPVPQTLHTIERWPAVEPSDWCGKFEKREDTQSPEQKTLEYCLKYAVTIATNIVKSHYPENNVWKPLNDLPGVLSQIDNAVCGLERKKE
jgi:hypothetical protein